MLAVLLIIVLFVALSIYFFFRAEKLQHSLLRLNRETSNKLKENTALTKSIALIASNHEEFAKSRLQKLLTNKEQCSGNIELIKPLINNYAVIFSECLKEKGKLQVAAKKCFENQGAHDYKEFVNKVIKNDEKIQRLWTSNNVIGFISLVEALLVKYESVETDSSSTQSTLKNLETNKN
jgi:hypothetical protein